MPRKRGESLVVTSAVSLILQSFNGNTDVDGNLHHFPHGGIALITALEIKCCGHVKSPGMMIFTTNDKERRYFQERYILDFADESREGCYLWVYFGTLNEAARFVSFHCLEGRKVKATMEGIREALDTYQNEKPDDVSWLFEEFKIVEE